MSVPTSAFGPAFFLLGGQVRRGRSTPNGTIVGPTTLVANNSTPAKPGETIALFATGLGNTTPGGRERPGGELERAARSAGNGARSAALPATVSFAGLTSTGLYQVNVVVPASAPDGDDTLTVSVGGYTSPGGVFVNVAK